MVSTSPISKLDDDTFLTIIDAITCQIPSIDTLQDRPLTVIRAASQVCQRWRGLLLASPWIWGRVIDLGITNDSGPRRIEWMDEVVRRAGSAPLWISGNVRVGEPLRVGFRVFNTQLYFIRLLGEWERIEQLSVVIFGQQIPQDIQSRFLSPAPILKLFGVNLLNRKEPLFLNTLQSGSSQSLFADHAPSLRHIRTEKVLFKSNSGWLPNIRTINPIPSKFTLNDIFALLQHTPVLEDISLNTTRQIWDGTLDHFPKPRLPNLSSITMFITRPTGARILDHVTPSKLSVLRIYVQRNKIPALNDSYFLSSFKHNMPIYISSYFTSNRSTVPLLLEIKRKGFRFWDVSQGSFDNQTFAVVIETTDQKDTDDVTACVLDAFTLSPALSQDPSLFKSITELTLDLIQAQPTVLPKIYSMFALFQHVQVIKADEHSGQTFWSICCLDEAAGDQRLILFPKLHTLHLRSLTGNRDDGNEYTGLTSFLMMRKKIGFPVARLDLTDCRQSRYAQGFSALEAVEGLEVVWKERIHGFALEDKFCSYICGTGEPDKLKGLLPLPVVGDWDSEDSE